MMKKIIFVLTLLSLAACSSSPSKIEVADSPLQTGDTSGNRAESMPIPKEDASDEIIKEKVVAPPAPQSQYDALNDSIKAQNDEKIYTTASQILSQTPTDLKALNAMAMFNYKKGRFDVAKYLLSKGTSYHKNSSELYSNLGIVLLAQNERREAIKAFRKALTLNSNDQVASANLGAIYVQEKDYAKAAIALETAYSRGLRDAKILNNFGIALAATHKYERAEDVYKAALKDQSNSKEVLLNYAILLIDNMGKMNEGLEVINRLKFVGLSSESRNRINALENKAKAGVK